MANTTIYPYGTNGQLPSSIGVINDLTTGGADKALSAEMGKELGEVVNGVPEVVSTWAYGAYQYKPDMGSTFDGSVNTAYPYGNIYQYCKLVVKAGDKIHVTARHNGSYCTVVIVDSEGNVLTASGYNAVNSDYTITADGFAYITNKDEYTGKVAKILAVDGLVQHTTALSNTVNDAVSQIDNIDEDIESIENAMNGRHIVGTWSARCWVTPTSIAVGDVFSTDLPNQDYGNDQQYDHCEKLQLIKGDTLVVKSKVSAYYQTVVITKTNGEVVVASGTGEIDQSFSIEHNGYAYINKDKSYTGQKAEIHMYSPKEYTDEKFEAVSDFVDQQKLVGELFLSGYAFFNESKGTIFNPRGYSLNGARIYIYQVVAGQKFSKIVASSFTGNYADYVFTDNAGRILKTSGADTYNTGIRTMNNVTAPEGATRLYVSENTANGEGSSSVYSSVIDSDAMVATRNLEATKMKISAEELVRYYHLGAQKMDTYNLVREKVGIITIGQSNIDGRIAAADFPATANINGTDISLAKSIPTCKYMRGTADSATYDEATKSFAAYNNAGAWSFDQVVYNAIANALGSETDFYVCKQSRGGTSIGYAQYTSFCADIDGFKFYNGRDWSQLYHLKCLVKRALELQPDLKFKAIIMHQGEQDENIVKTSGTYYINLCRLIQWIRGLVGSPKLPFIFGSIPTNSSSFNQIIYDDMVRVAADLNDVYLVTIGEATDWVDDQWHSGTTGLHFGANTAVKLADDMYQLMVSRKMLAPYV